jgi:hypothetical protein
LLDHTTKRVAHHPAKLQRFEEATHDAEHSHLVEYRLTYELRNYVMHCDFIPVEMHIASRNTQSGREDYLTLQLRPEYLLESWSGWTPKVRSDLRSIQEPMELIPLVDAAMVCIERVMDAILVADAPEHLAADRQVVQAVERIPSADLEGGASPMLFSAQVRVDGFTDQVSPFPLPIQDARSTSASTHRRWG